MTATSSTGFVSSRPETPNVTSGDFIEGTAPTNPINVRDLSMDGNDSLNGRGGIRRTTDEYGNGYGAEIMPMNNITNEKGIHS